MNTTEQRTIFEELDIDSADLADKIAKIRRECSDRGERDIEFIKKLKDRLTPLELAIICRIQDKGLRAILRQQTEESDIAYR